jgi:oligopeptide transport system ATP-binding protein
MLEIKELKVSFHTYMGEVQAVRGVNLKLQDGEILAIVGESGCGKSVTAQSVLQLHDPAITEYKEGKILLDGKNLLELSDKHMQEIRGKEISMIFQDPMTSLNPTMTVGNQIIEVLREHEKNSGGKKISRKEAREKVIELFKMVRLPNPEQRINSYPHEFSGGQRQRIMIAMAMACQPRILIADEPTTALDVTVQAQIIELMKEMQKESGSSIIMISHDMGAVASIAQKVAVMYGGLVVESGTVEDIFYRHEHPYTRGLLESVPKGGERKDKKLESIEGTPPNLVNPPKGCPFADRCKYAMQVCKEHLPEESSLSESHKCRCWLLDSDCPYPRLSLSKY